MQSGSISIGLEEIESKNLVGFICSYHSQFIINSVELNAVEVNFLCVMRNYRSKRLAPLLISEITRLNNLNGVFNAIFTSGTLIGQPFSRAQYFHLPINIKKLQRCGFISEGIYCKEKVEYLSDILVRKISDCSIDDVLKVWANFQKFCNKNFDFYPQFTFERFQNIFVNDSETITALVGFNKCGDPVSMISSYVIGSKVTHGNNDTCINCAYLFYYYVQEENQLKVLFSKLKEYLAFKEIDVINCLNIMKNQEIIEEFEFKPGDGFLNYYFYNWETSYIPLDKLAYAVF